MLYKKTITFFGLAVCMLSQGIFASSNRQSFSYTDIENIFRRKANKALALEAQNRQDQTTYINLIEQLLPKYREQFNGHASKALSSDEVRTLKAKIRCVVREQMVPEVAFNFAHKEAKEYYSSSYKSLPCTHEDIAQSAGFYFLRSTQTKLKNSPKGNVERLPQRVREHLRADFVR